MGKQVIHEGRKSWWNGTVRTLCGLVLEHPQKLWFISPNCPTCKRLRREGQRI